MLVGWACGKYSLDDAELEIKSFPKKYLRPVGLKPTDLNISKLAIAMPSERLYLLPLSTLL